MPCSCILAISVFNTKDFPSTLSTLLPIWFDTVVAKFASLPKAVANSFKVFNASGAEPTKPATLLFT